ncbi:MAG: SUMF1/EgtB/PvdO family nonheme iron enzyme [Chitinophagales bacterium]
MSQNSPIKIFIAYARLDEGYLEQLRRHLRPLELNRMIEVWYDGVIAPGEKWEYHIKENLKAAKIILLLVSVNSLNSRYFYDEEMKQALERHGKGEVIVIPVILDHCMWDITPIAELKALPKDGIPIEDWDRAAKAYHNVVRGIHQRIKELRAKENAAREAELQKQRDAKQKVEEEKEKERIKRLKAKAAIEAKLQKEAEAKRKAAIEETKRLKEREKLSKLHPQIQKLLQDMVFIEGGSFQMGSEDYKHTKPVHPVTIPNFKMAKYPVTQAQWRAVMGSNPPELKFKGCDDCPVERVSWKDCKEFIRKLNELTGQGFRLPSESEWEFAARGGKKSKEYKYAGSNNIEEVAWYSGNSGRKTHPVGGLKSNELGLYDMSGNVFEWCEDDWHDTYDDAPNDGKAWIASPRPASRVRRGGSWYYYYYYCRSTNRNDLTPSKRNYDSGLRLAQNSLPSAL